MSLDGVGVLDGKEGHRGRLNGFYGYGSGAEKCGL